MGLILGAQRVAAQDAGPAASAASSGTAIGMPLQAPPEASVESPTHVTVGVYLNQIISIDLRANQLTADFWLWFRWRGTARNPSDTFEIVGGRVNSRANSVRRTLPDGWEYAAVRLNVTITRQWDLTRFPFDDHMLEIVVEDAELAEAQFVFASDAVNTGMDPELSVPGWIVGDSDTHVLTHTYQSNYGDTSIEANAESRYSRFVFSVHLRRVGIARFFKVFFGLFVATLVAWFAFLFRPKDAASRVGVSIGSLFAAAASSIAINAQLPDVNGITLADEIVFLCLGAILTGLVLSIISLRLSDAPDAALAGKVNRVATVAFPVVIVVTMVVLVNL